MSLFCLCVNCEGNEPEYMCENAILEAFVKAKEPIIQKNKIMKLFHFDYISYTLIISLFYCF